MKSRGLRWGIAVGAGVLLAILFIFLRGSLSSSPRVLADSSLSDLLTELVDIYRLHSGEEMDIRFDSSMLLAQAIEGGRGGDIFIGSSSWEMDLLQEKGKIDPSSRRVLFRTQLVLIEHPSREGWEDRMTAGADALRRPDVGRMAVVPSDRSSVGQYTDQVLEARGDLATVTAESSGDVIDLVVQGKADSGITYWTDARRSPEVRIVFVFPEGSHDPIRYEGALLGSGRHREKAAAFLEWLSARERYLAIRTHGFMTPE